MNINHETQRKSRLLDLFWEVQENERREVALVKRKIPSLKYERIFRGMAFIETIRDTTIQLIGENGRRVAALEITPKIAGLLRSDDHLLLTAGLRHGIWRVISLHDISPDFENQPDSWENLSAMNLH
jgi:hypothetical protein